MKEDKISETSGMYGEMRKAFTILVGKPERKRGLRVDRRIETHSVDLEQIRHEGVDWIQPAQFEIQSRAVVNTVMKHLVQIKKDSL
jgi:hypothetical protein